LTVELELDRSSLTSMPHIRGLQLQRFLPGQTRTHPHTHTSCQMLYVDHESGRQKSRAASLFADVMLLRPFHIATTESELN